MKRIRAWLKDIVTPETRQRWYRISLATGPLLIFYGIVSEQEWALIIPLIQSIILPSVADANVNLEGE